MTIKELIKKLRKYDKELEVKIEDVFEGYAAETEILEVKQDNEHYVTIC